MEFDINKVYTIVNANEIKIGSIGYFADTLLALKNYVTEENSDKRSQILRILSSDNKDIFTMRNGYSYPLFYLLEEPKEENYRSYRNIEEFITDYCGRFRVYSPSFRYPQIWVDIGYNTHILISGYDLDTNKVLLQNNWASLNWLFRHCTYIDGSKCGIKIKGEIND